MHYGYGTFEGIRAYQTVNGVKIFKAYEHFERLKRSCELVGYSISLLISEELTQISYQVLKEII
jgi:branched-chain amino acid aminotransferase